MFHAGNDALSSWIGWSVLADVRQGDAFFDKPVSIIAAGLAAGFTYWLVAGWSAGFWKPVFRSGRAEATAVDTYRRPDPRE